MKLFKRRTEDGTGHEARRSVRALVDGVILAESDKTVVVKAIIISRRAR